MTMESARMDAAALEVKIQGVYRARRYIVELVEDPDILSGVAGDNRKLVQ